MKDVGAAAEWCCFSSTESTVDPLVLVIITLIALSGGGATGALVLNARSRRRANLQRALVEKIPHQSGAWSIFDVFWDLGVSDYALVLMDHNGLLPRDPADLRRAHSHLEDLIRAHGSYSEFISDNLEAIQEFYREHRAPGSRRRLTLMGGRAKKLLPISAESAPKTRALTLVERPTDLQPAAGGSSRDLSLGRGDEQYALLDNTVQPHAPSIPAPSGAPASGVQVDIDEVLRLRPGQMLKNIFDGRWRDTLDKWWKFRHLRAQKSRLDEALEAFYAFYADDASKRPGFFEMLYDIPRRWHDEEARIHALKDAAPWKDERFAEPAELLVSEAAQLAHQLFSRAQSNVHATIEQIHDAARANNRALAGYILYMNRHAFFAGRAPEYGYHADKIERLVHQVQQELRKLHRDRQL